FYFSVKNKIIDHDIVFALAEVAKAVADLTKNKNSALDNIAVSDAARNIAEQLINGEKSALLLGEYALHHPQASQLRALATFIAKASNSTVGELSDGANSAGAWL